MFSPPFSSAIVLAAGRGERMRPLTDHCPKPLLEVQGKPLMQYHLEALARADVGSVVVNTAWLGEQIEAKFSSHFGLQPLSNMREQLLNSEQIALTYSHEGRDFGAALETAGGIARALPQLAPAFWALAGDVFAPDLHPSQAALDRFAVSGLLAHLWLVPNPAHHPLGDFALDAAPLMAGATEGVGLCFDPTQTPHPISTPASGNEPARYTFSGFALYRRELFGAPWCDIAPGNPKGVPAKLAPLLRKAMAQAQVSAQIYTGRWTDVGTPQRLAELNTLTL
ncbi:MAG: nucleotidyltransferase family protein [Rhodoferax sp.]|nr:nucleotidyltransferase family protein [Rhodoferax sp.]